MFTPRSCELLNLLTTKQHRQRVLIIVQTIHSVGLAFQTQAVLVNLKIITTFTSYASYSNQPPTTKVENRRRSPLLLKTPLNYIQDHFQQSTEDRLSGRNQTRDWTFHM